MGLKCRISYNDKNEAVVYNEDGQQSDFYKRALAYTGNQKEALNLWAVANSEEFILSTGRVGTDSNTALGDVVRYYHTNVSLKNKLTPSEIFEIKSIMVENGVKTLSELTQKLKRAFAPNGIVNYSPEKALQSKLFSKEDLETLDIKRIVEMIPRLEGQILEQDFYIPTTSKDVEYKDSAVKDILGGSKAVSQHEIDDYLRENIDDFSSKEEFYQAVSQMPYPEFSDKFFSSEAFAEKIMARFRNLTSIPVIEERNGSLVSGTTKTFSTVKNTISDDLDAGNIGEEITYLESITDEIWKTSGNEVAAIVREIEETFAKQSLDIIGLSNISTDKETILKILRSVRDLANNPSDNNIQAFSDLYDDTFAVKKNKSVESLPNELKGLSIVKLYSEKSPQQLFEQFGLLKVGDNLYQKVKITESVTELYEYLFQEVRDGSLVLPEQYVSETNMINKEGVLRDISKYVNARETNLGFYSEKASLYQMIFQHPTLNAKAAEENLSYLATIRTNEDYLKGPFVSDFYKYYLKEKFENTAIYRDVLSKMDITSEDISITKNITSLEGVNFLTELRDYFRLKKDTSVNRFLPSDSIGDVSEDLIAANYPEKIEKYYKRVEQGKGLIATERTPSNYISVEGVVYKKVGENTHTSVFVKTIPNKSNTYLQTSVKTEFFSRDLVNSFLSSSTDFMGTETPTDLEKGRGKSGIASFFTRKIRQKSKDIAKSGANKNFEKNLVTFIREKGIDVITNKNLMLKELEKSMPLVRNIIQTNSPNITVRDFSVTVRVNPASEKVSTPQRVRSINDRYAEKIKTRLRGILGEDFKDSFVKPYFAGTHAGTVVEIPQSVMDKLNGVTQEDITVPEGKTPIIDIQEAIRDAAKLMQDEYDRVQDTNTFEDLGYDFNAAIANYNLENKGDVNFLETPAGDVLGFEKNGKIYLDEDQLNNTTTLHELIHVFQAAIDVKAAQGDNQAKSIISKREELFQDLVDGWKTFHDKVGGIGQNTSFSIIGEKGAANLDYNEEVTFRLDNLEVAKQMTEAGKSPKEIRLATGWELNSGDKRWRYEVDPNLKMNTLDVDGKSLGEVATYPELFKAFPEVKDVALEVVDYESVDFDANFQPERDTIQISSYLIDEDSSDLLNRKLLHELQHKVQMLEGWNPASNKDIASAATGLGKVGIISPYSDVEDNSTELLEDILSDLRNSNYNTLEDFYNINLRNTNAYKLIKYYLINNLGVTDSKVKSFSKLTVGESPVNTFNTQDYENSKEGVLEYLKDEKRDLFTRTGIDSVEQAEEILKTVDPESMDYDDARFVLRKAPELDSQIREVENGNFTTEDGWPSLRLEVKTIFTNNPEIASTDFNRILTSMQDFYSDQELDSFETYWRMQSEVEARNVESRLELTPEERRSTLLAMTEDVSEGDQIFLQGDSNDEVNFQVEESRILSDKIGLDLTSPAYARRNGETDLQWNNRLLKEVEAYVVSPDIASKLEQMQQDNPTLWEKITGFIENLKNWLKEQIGLADTDKDIMSMSKEEYISALGVSVLKDDYSMSQATNSLSNDMLNEVTSLDSQVEVLSLHTETEEEELFNKIDNCEL